MLRLSIALFLTPLFVNLFYFLAYLLFAMNVGAEAPELSAYMIGLLPYTYAGTIIFILPLVVYFERTGRRKLWHYLIAGSVLGAALVALAIVILARDQLTVYVASQAGIAGIVGCLVAAIFWMIAFFGKSQNAN